MKGWVKYFTDGSIERGIDSEVRRKTASWSKGRLKSISHVEAHHDRYIIRIFGQGTYHQSDDFEVNLLNSRSKTIKRRLQKLVTKDDKWIMILSTLKTFDAKIFSLDPSKLSSSKIGSYPNGTQKNITKIEEEFIGKWLTVELDIRAGEIKLYYSDEKI